MKPVLRLGLPSLSAFSVEQIAQIVAAVHAMQTIGADVVVDIDAEDTREALRLRCFDNMRQIEAGASESTVEPSFAVTARGRAWKPLPFPREGAEALIRAVELTKN